MHITGFETEKAILNELGERIRQHRLSLNLTQAELAQRCGISSSTEVRIENGDDSKMSNYIKILTALKLSNNFDLLIPESQQDFKAIFDKKSVRRRARPSKPEPSSAWVWGEDSTK